MTILPEVDFAWSVRVRRTDEGDARAYARRASFDVGSQASLRESDGHPSAVEYALGALGGDLVHALAREAAARRLPIDAIEIALSGRLNNILVHLGVVGEEGHPGFQSIEGVVYVGTAASDHDVRSAWQSALRCSPLFSTLSRSADVRIDLRIVD